MSRSNREARPGQAVDGGGKVQQDKVSNMNAMGEAKAASVKPQQQAQPDWKERAASVAEKVGESMAKSGESDGGSKDGKSDAYAKIAKGTADIVNTYRDRKAAKK